ncbi:hypothetical protein C8F04DRAFT_960981 [Mycena alexandri]|uniref:Uncharacterized protein n=1 Tax=Mycena alexandri TaxID=1745969 RepID=A0AAD6SN21_9AGAR|nr:hypothetical protein C8F04DRAFT_960981 [Mycena alexandri]
MSGRGCFRLGHASAPLRNILGPSTSTQFTFSAYLNPTPPPPPVGLYQHDLASGAYPLTWNTWDEFQRWRVEEERQGCIELRLVNTFVGLPEYERQCRYICSRAGTGGLKEYTKLHPEWQRKIPPKRTDCKCILMAK